jgi:hypothetical protein
MNFLKVSRIDPLPLWHRGEEMYGQCIYTRQSGAVCPAKLLCGADLSDFESRSLRHRRVIQSIDFCCTLDKNKGIA